MIKNMNELTRNPDLRIRKLDGIYYLTDINKCYKANELGAIIVKNIGKDMAIEGLVSKVSTKYGNPDKEMILNDISQYLSFLLTEGIIHYEEK